MQRGSLSDTTLFHPILSLKITESYFCTKAPLYKEPHRNKLCPHNTKYSDSMYVVLWLPPEVFPLVSAD